FAQPCRQVSLLDILLHYFVHYFDVLDPWGDIPGATYRRTRLFAHVAQPSSEMASGASDLLRALKKGRSPCGAVVGGRQTLVWVAVGRVQKCGQRGGASAAQRAGLNL